MVYFTHLNLFPFRLLILNLQKMYSHTTIFLNQARTAEAPGFLKSFLFTRRYVCMYVCVSVCVSAPGAINNQWHDMV